MLPQNNFASKWCLLLGKIVSNHINYPIALILEKLNFISNTFHVRKSRIIFEAILIHMSVDMQTSIIPTKPVNCLLRNINGAKKNVLSSHL